MKKLIAILLLGALLTLSFVGCNEQPNSGVTPNNTDNTTTPEVTTPEVTTPTPDVTVPEGTAPPVETTTPQPETPPPPQLAEDYTEISFNVRLLAQPSSLPVVETFNVKLDNGEISINDILYDEFELISAPEVVFGAELLQSIEQNEKALQVVEQIKSSENCYLLTSSTNSLLAPKLAVYDIDDHCYFISFYENGEVARIHYQSFLFSTALQLNRIFNMLKASSLENSKITYSIVNKDTYYELKQLDKYDADRWGDAGFTIRISCDYENALEEEWYKQCANTDKYSLNAAFYNHWKTCFSNGDFYNNNWIDGLLLSYSSIDNFCIDYATMKILNDLHYVISIQLTYSYGLPDKYIFG